MIKYLTRIPRSTYLLISILLFIFVNPLFQNNQFQIIINILSYSLIFLTTNFAINNRTPLIKILLYIGVTLQFLVFFPEKKIVQVLIFSFSGIVFIIVTTLLILQIARAKKLSIEIIAEAISGYLLIGVVATLLNIILMIFNSNAISFSGDTSIGQMVYFSFVTLTTIGYGEILPISPMARNISLITGIAGQLYLTIIIALIIGKASVTSK